MDEITKELQQFLIRMHYEPQSVSHKMEHYVEHLVRLLLLDEEEALLHYFGILGREQKGLGDIARHGNMTEEDAMASIDRSLRQLAITPEWQMLRQTMKP